MSELPPDIQAAIHSADLPTKVQSIGQKYQLHIDQIWQLDDEVMLVMLGFANPNAFVASLMHEMHIPEATAQLIAADVSSELFMPIRESMRHFAEANISSDAPAVAAAPVVPQKPKLEFPKADVMLTQKTVTPPVMATAVAAGAAQPVHEALVSVPSKLQSITAPPVKPKMPPAPIAPVASVPTPTPPLPAAPAAPAPAAAPTSGYKTDPYREPIE